MVPKVAGSSPGVRPSYLGFLVEFLKAIFLGIIQGLTEFFPISSSAHLKLIKYIFNVDFGRDNILFDLVCHLGTILASIIFLRLEVKKIIKDKHSIFLFFVAILPLFFFYFFLKPYIVFFSDIFYLPFFLFFSSILLFYISKKDFKKQTIPYKKKIKDVFFIGIMQSLALLPGISRSASTISSAHIRGWDIKESIKFSFLLSIPTILDGSFLESFKIFLKKEQIEISYIPLVLAFIFSFGVGLLCIRYIFKIDSSKKLKPFAIYLLLLSFFSFIYININ